MQESDIPAKVLQMCFSSSFSHARGMQSFSLKSFNLTTLTTIKMISLTIKALVLFFYHGQKMGQWRMEETLHCAVAT